jgi:predicted MFS family arabinose efflux permease
VWLVREPPQKTATDKKSQSPTSGSARFIKERRFWLIALPVLGISVTVFGVSGSFVPILGDRSLSAATVAMVLSASGLSSWVGRIAVGYAMDRLFAPYIAAFTFVLALAGVALLGTGDSFSSALMGAVLIGFALGAEGDVVTFLASRYFSAAQYSQVLGALWVMWAWGGGIGMAIVGLTHRATHSYQIAFLVFSALLIASAWLICRLGPYTQQARV